MAVGVAANNRIMSAIGTAFYRVATNGMYDVDFKTREGSDSSKASAPEQKPEGKKSEGKKSEGKKSSKGKVGGITKVKTPTEPAPEQTAEVELKKPDTAVAGK